MRWCECKAAGSSAPATPGGGRRSHRIEADAKFILSAVEATPDVTPEELRAKFIDARGVRFGLTTI